MSDKLNYSVIGLQEFVITFEKYCNPCEIQQHCNFGKKNPFTVKINCNNINSAKERIKYEKLKKLQKTEDITASYDDLIKKVHINLQSIFSELWKKKVKSLKEEIRCLDSRKVDSILVAQQGQDWWQDFNKIMNEINEECEKIM
ncbi:MAG: hypothetical protein GF329_15890 [Candidatus Lokiarchaeota archaeon]|nr:hypothetical protein [Candidatus Lokiarchaeota archaeon]